MPECGKSHKNAAKISYTAPMDIFRPICKTYIKRKNDFVMIEEEKFHRLLTDMVLKRFLPVELYPQFREFSPENLAFLKLLSDFRAGHVFGHAVLLRGALYRILEDDGLLELDYDSLIRTVSRLNGVDPVNLKFALEYSVEYLWSCCDPERTAEQFFRPAGAKMPDASSPPECVKFLAKAMAVEYERYRYFPEFYR